MKESGYYPAGAESDPSAPYNQSDIPEKDFDVTCSQSLSKTTIITTNNYVPGASGVDYEPDDEGGYYASGWQDPDDTSDTDWSKEYDDNGHYTPLQIIQHCEELCKYLLERDITSYGKNSLKKLMEECQDWQDDETEYIIES